MDLTNTVIRINSAVRRGGFRFLSPTGIQGSTITAAVMQIFIDGTANDDPDLVIYADPANAPGTFTSAANDITDRGTTTASVAIDATGVGFGFYSLPSLVSVVQEVADNGAFDESAIAMLLYGQSTNSVQIRTYDDDSADAAKLDIDFTAAGVGNPWYYYAQQ